MGRAIVRDPQVFLFDEPLSNLDAKLRVQMRGEIKELHQRLKTTTIYVTHDQVEAMTMADRIVVMRDGVVEQVGAPLELYDRPATLFVAGFIGSPAMNLLKGSIRVDGKPSFLTETGVELPLKSVPGGADGRPCVYGFRPEHLSLGGGDSGPRSRLSSRPDRRLRFSRSSEASRSWASSVSGSHDRVTLCRRILTRSICSTRRPASGSGNAASSRLDHSTSRASMRYEMMLPHQIRTAIEADGPSSCHSECSNTMASIWRSGWTRSPSPAFSTSWKRNGPRHSAAVLYGAASYAVEPPERNGTLHVDAEALLPFAKAMFQGLLRIGFRNIHLVVHHQTENFLAGMPTDLAFKFAARQAIFAFLERERGEGWWGMKRWPTTMRSSRPATIRSTGSRPIP